MYIHAYIYLYMYLCIYVYMYIIYIFVLLDQSLNPIPDTRVARTRVSIYIIYIDR